MLNKLGYSQLFIFQLKALVFWGGEETKKKKFFCFLSSPFFSSPPPPPPPPKTSAFSGLRPRHSKKWDAPVSISQLVFCIDTVTQNRNTRANCLRRSTKTQPHRRIPLTIREKHTSRCHQDSPLAGCLTNRDQR
jgi:hypothetical protein